MHDIDSDWVRGGGADVGDAHIPDARSDADADPERNLY